MQLLKHGTTRQQSIFSPGQSACGSAIPAKLKSIFRTSLDESPKASDLNEDFQCLYNQASKGSKPADQQCEGGAFMTEILASNCNHSVNKFTINKMQQPVSDFKTFAA